MISDIDSDEAQHVIPKPVCNSHMIYIILYNHQTFSDTFLCPYWKNLNPFCFFFRVFKVF